MIECDDGEPLQDQIKKEGKAQAQQSILPITKLQTRL